MGDEHDVTTDGRCRARHAEHRWFNRRGCGMGFEGLGFRGFGV